MGKRSNFDRLKGDTYYTTDPAAGRALKPYLNGTRTFAEPCAGRGDLIIQLYGIGLTCVLAEDIAIGTDALTITDFCGADAIITNPPWSRHLLHPMIEHFQKYAPTWLLFDSDWAFTLQATRHLDRCSHIVAVGRMKWMQGSPNTGLDNVSWYRFEASHTGGPRFYGRR